MVLRLVDVVAAFAAAEDSEDGSSERPARG